MSITDKIKSTIDAYKQRRDLNTYDHLRLIKNGPTIGHIKAERLRIKNMRRAECGLPPKSTYAEI